MELVSVLDETAVCSVCGSPKLDVDCEVCWQSTIYYDLCRALFRYDGPIQQMIHELKYNGLSAPATWFAPCVAEYIRAHDEFDKTDIIFAVPLHRVRKRERGYNQSELIAGKVAKTLGIEYYEPVYRKHYTQSQTHLDKVQRMQNLKSAFALKGKRDLTDKHILILDDVFTTGSTINEISKILRTANPQTIKAITVARA